MYGLEFALGERRASIVAALNGLVATVGGDPVALTAFLDQPATVERYQAWPVWLSGAPFTKVMTETFWQVVVTLPPANQASMIDAADALISTVADALETLGKVTTVRPARLIVAGDDGGVPILQYELTI
jgi:hypothetical protein